MVIYSEGLIMFETSGYSTLHIGGCSHLNYYKYIWNVIMLVKPYIQENLNLICFDEVIFMNTEIIEQQRCL